MFRSFIHQCFQNILHPSPFEKGCKPPSIHRNTGRLFNDLRSNQQPAHSPKRHPGGTSSADQFSSQEITISTLSRCCRQLRLSCRKHGRNLPWIKNIIAVGSEPQMVLHMFLRCEVSILMSAF